MNIQSKIAQIIITVVYGIHAHSCIQAMVITTSDNIAAYVRVVTPTIGNISPFIINNLANANNPTLIVQNLLHKIDMATE